MRTSPNSRAPLAATTASAATGSTSSARRSAVPHSHILGPPGGARGDFKLATHKDKQTIGYTYHVKKQLAAQRTEDNDDNFVISSAMFSIISDHMIIEKMWLIQKFECNFPSLLRKEA